MLRLSSPASGAAPRAALALKTPAVVASTAFPAANGATSVIAPPPRGTTTIESATSSGANSPPIHIPLMEGGDRTATPISTAIVAAFDKNTFLAAAMAVAASTTTGAWGMAGASAGAARGTPPLSLIDVEAPAT